MKSYKKITIGEHLKMVNSLAVKLDAKQSKMISLKQKKRKCNARIDMNKLWRLYASCCNNLLKRIPDGTVLVSDECISTNDIFNMHTSKIIFL